jgi:hypothetical protein
MFKSKEPGLRFRAVWVLGDQEVWKYLLKKFEYGEEAFQSLNKCLFDDNLAVKVKALDSMSFLIEGEKYNDMWEFMQPDVVFNFMD